MSNRPAALSGQEIADILGITRQGVSQSLRRSMRKCYYFIRSAWPELSPLTASIFLLKWLDRAGTLQFDDNELVKFNHLYPPDIRDEIEADIESKRGLSYLTILEQVNEIFDFIKVEY